MQAELLQSPETYIHQCNFYGKQINPVKLNLRWKEYVKQMYLKQLIQACKSTERIAVHSAILTRTERDKYKGSRYYAEKKVYYLFKAEAVPLEIYCKITPVDGKLVYEMENGRIGGVEK